jgi:hypothetical protein
LYHGGDFSLNVDELPMKINQELKFLAKSSSLLKQAEEQQAEEHLQINPFQRV